MEEEVGSMRVAEVRRLKQLEDENAKPKRPAADLSLDKAILQDMLGSESGPRPALRAGRGREGCLLGFGAPGMPRAVLFAGNKSFCVSEAWAEGSSDADQGDRRGVPWMRGPIARM